MKHKINIILGLLFILASCGGDSKNKNAEELKKLRAEQKELQKKITELEKKTGIKDSIVPVAVELTNMYPTVFQNYLEIQGKVDAGEMVSANPEAPGIVSSINVHNGSYVRKGQVLATLKAETINNGIAELDQQISFAKTLYEKQKRLWAQEIGTEVQLLTAKNNYEALLKKKATIKSQRSMYYIKAPIGGVVDEVNIKVGDMASPGIPNMIRIVNASNLKVKADVPEAYVGQVRSGSKAMIIFPDSKDTVGGTVRYIQRMINPVSRTFNAEIGIPGGKNLQPNMLSIVKIVTYSNSRAFVLPIRCIQKINGKDYVFIHDGMNQAKLAPVTLGNTFNGKVEILSGLNLDDKVVTTGYEELNDGDKISF